MEATDNRGFDVAVLAERPRQVARANAPGNVGPFLVADIFTR